MKIELSADSEAKIDELLELVSTRYNLQELTTEDLLDALLDLGIDMLISDEASMPIATARFIDYCGRKIRARQQMQLFG